jgi:Rieske Fe-S protein
MYVATGYGGNGMVYSAAAALLLTDMVMGVKTNYQQLFDPNRLKPIAGFKNFIKEASDVVGKLAATIIPPGNLKILADLAPGEARLVKYESHRLAIYKDENGEIFTVSAACTHIKCEVAWNSAEKSWDCPCHGSRFSYTGEMLTAPARKDLNAVNIVEEAERLKG